MSILKSCLSIIIVFFGSISLNAQLCPFPIITAELTTGIWAGEISWGSDIEWLIAIENIDLCIECPGGIDGNGSLGVSDLNIILSEFGCTQNCQSDFNADGSTTIGDLLFWLSLFGTVC